MDASGRRWFLPNVRDFVGPDSLSLVRAFGSLTEYFRRTVGVWREVSGTTNAGGELTVPHYAPFVPSAVLVTEKFVGASTHNQGAFHVDSVDKDNVTLHFLVATSGNDRSNTAVAFYMLCLP